MVVEELAILAIIAAYAVALAFPLLFIGYKVYRNSPSLPRPGLFAVVALLMSYGIVSLASFAIAAPLEAYDAFIGPRLHILGLPHGEWLISANEVTSAWLWLVAPFIASVASIFVCARLLPKWALVVQAVGS